MNINASIKKWHENQYLNYFIGTDCGNNFCVENKIKSISSDEEPDFLICSQTGKTIGIEIVNFMVDADSELYLALNNVCQNVFLQIQQKLKNKYFFTIYYPKPIDAKTTKLNKTQMINLLFQKIESLEKKHNENNSETGSWDYINIGGNNEILFRYEIHDKHFWGTSGTGGIIIKNPFEELEDCILKKDIKYSNYMKKCDSCALLIVSESFKTKSAPVDFDNTDSVTFKTKFDYLFLLELGMNPRVCQ